MEDERFPGCVTNLCVLSFGHEGDCYAKKPDTDNALESVAKLAEFANAVASMVVGHRKILVEGGFDVNLADSMASALHAQVLGLVHVFEEEDDGLHFLEFLVGGNDEDGDDE